MQAIPEAVRRVLRSWLATEVLTPQVTRNGWSGLAAEKQGQQRNRQSTAADDPGLWTEPGDGDPPPWTLRIEPIEPEGGQIGAPEADGEEKPRPPKPWFYVVLGALPAKEAFARLDALFADETDEDETNRRTMGYVIGACAVLDEWGVLVPDTLSIASFAWGLGHLCPAARHRILPLGMTRSRTSGSASAIS